LEAVHVGLLSNRQPLTSPENVMSPDTDVAELKPPRIDKFQDPVRLPVSVPTSVTVKLSFEMAADPVWLTPSQEVPQTFVNVQPPCP
jgi:hypothetical protein